MKANGVSLAIIQAIAMRAASDEELLYRVQRELQETIETGEPYIIHIPFALSRLNDALMYRFRHLVKEWFSLHGYDIVAYMETARSLPEGSSTVLEFRYRKRD